MFREHDLSCIVYIYNSAVNFTDLTDYCIVFLINFDCACCALSSNSHEAVAWVHMGLNVCMLSGVSTS